ncbi:AAA family ATPase [Kitasatospora sp. NBC_01287]|uniref:AAA family ATPase n=1 Tax=Kitasatospora sp. NBC_01287 TaxID=2903573 RepID=UPI0022570165|nr:LuxR family transcriptional regulator [Kitasatospora sp. NBC_01287]MCX4751601.1 AAA family ATPase [Kitasatospora sp. NBC_01287]
MMVDTVSTPKERDVRQSELDRLRALVRAAREGRSAGVQVTGEPGAGKTRLLGLLAREAERHGVTVARGLGGEAAQLPYHPFVQALTAVRERLADAVAGPGLPAALRSLAHPPLEGGGPPAPADVRRLLAGCASGTPGGLLLLLDDFHWADRASVELLELLMRRPVAGGLGLVIAYRPWQAGATLRAAARLGVELGTAEELALGPLTLPQSASLLGTDPGDARAALLHERSHGNPLYLTALAEAPTGPPCGAAAGEPHPGLRARLLAETVPLAATTQLAARAAAVIGETFDVESVAAVAELPHSAACRALGELRRRDLVRPAAAAGRLLFRHPLLREFLNSEGDSCWRTEAHRRALRHLADTGAAPMELAPHVIGSGPLMAPGDRAVLEAAVRAALAAGQPVLAAGWTIGALRLRRAAGAAATVEHERCGLWLPVVQALAADGRIAQLRSVVGEILPSLAAAPAAERAGATVWLATVHASLGRTEEAGSLLDGALTEFGHRPELRAMLRVQVQLGRVLGGQLPPRAEVDALARESAGADQVTVGGCLVLRGMCAIFAGDLAAAGQALDEGARRLDTADADGPPAAGFASFLTVLASAESALGRYGAAQAHAARALAEVRLRGDRHLMPVLLNVQAYVAYQSGRMAEALEAARAAGAGARAMGRRDQALLAEALTAAAWAWLGGAVPQTDQPARTASGSGSASTSTSTSTTATANMTEGDPGAMPRATVAALLFAEAALATGDGDRARALLLPGRGRLSEPSAVLAARVYELLTAAAVAVREPAEEWVRRAEAAAVLVDLPEQSGHALLARGHLLAARDLAEQAARCYEEAHRLLGDSAAGVRAKELALAAGAGARRGRHSELDNLTLREREVAELAGQGLKSRDIAELLALSPRTVDVHLARIYRKVGVNSRAALVRLMADAAPAAAPVPAPRDPRAVLNSRAAGGPAAGRH